MKDDVSMQSHATHQATRPLPLALLIFFGLLSVASAETYTPGQKINQDHARFARPFLAKHCIECHGETDPEGKLSLHALGPVDEVNAATWKAVWGQVTLKEMPPKDADQPKVIERLQFTDWIVGELTRVMRDKGGSMLTSIRTRGTSSITICCSVRCLTTSSCDQPPRLRVSGE